VVATDELLILFSHVPTKIKSFITVPWCGLPFEAGGNPGNGIVGSVSHDEE
jgi:hypothetical protein